MVNDTPRALAGCVTATLTNGAGAVLAQWQHPAQVDADSAAAVATLDLHTWVDPTQLTDAVLWLRFVAATGETADNLVLLDRPKHLALRDPQLLVQVAPPAADGACAVTVSAAAPAFWVELRCPGMPDAGPLFDDNYVAVFPGQPWQTTFRPGPGDATRTVIARSLFNQCP